MPCFDGVEKSWFIPVHPVNGRVEVEGCGNGGTNTGDKISAGLACKTVAEF
jgi:hypothetical protein